MCPCVCVLLHITRKSHARYISFVSKPTGSCPLPRLGAPYNITEVTTVEKRARRGCFGPPMLGIMPARARATSDAFKPALRRCSLNVSRASIVTPRYLISVRRPDLFVFDSESGGLPLFCSRDEHRLRLLCRQAQSMSAQPVSYHFNSPRLPDVGCHQYSSPRQ